MKSLTGYTPTCVNCGEEYLHHYEIEVFERAEDAENGHHVFIDKDAVVVDQNLGGNPSDRRNGLKVKFFCEYCDTISILTISQHKGCTYFNVEALQGECDLGNGFQVSGIREY